VALTHVNDIQIQDYLDKNLAREQAAVFEQHIEECDVCRRQVQMYQNIYSGLGEEPQFTLSPKFAGKVLKAANKASLGSVHGNLWQVFLGLFALILGINISFYYVDVKSWLNDIKPAPVDMTAFSGSISIVKQFFSGLKIDISIFSWALAVLLILSLIDHMIQPKGGATTK
jgi:hypothetical protein